jgi:hypothetical protein
MVDKKDKNYCALILEEHGFAEHGKLFRKIVKDRYIYAKFHRNITVTFTLSDKDYETKTDYKDPCIKFHFNDRIELFPLVMKKFDEVHDRLILLSEMKIDWSNHQSYQCFVYLEDENHAIFSRYFLKRNAKIHTQDYFSTKVGFVDLEPKEEGNIKYEEDDVSLLEATYSISYTDSSGT